MSETGMGLELIHLMTLTALHMRVHFMKTHLKSFSDGFKLWHKRRRKTLRLLKMQAKRGKNGSLMTKLLLTELIWVRRENISLSFIGTDLSQNICPFGLPVQSLSAGYST